MAGRKQHDGDFRPTASGKRHGRAENRSRCRAGERRPATKTLADREMAFRKRQKESQEGAEQADKEQRLAAQKKENCENARRSLQLLESGERVAMRDSKGERYYLDEAQRTQAIAKLRQDVQASCH
jgi:uncharacterized protein (DUF3084 family)